MPDIELIDVPNLAWPGAAASVLSTPPASPVTGDTYIVGASPTGAWVGHANHVAWYGADLAWHFQTPFTGRRVYVTGLTAYRQWNGSLWVADAAGTLPSGGATGQVLTKASATDGDASWQTPASSGAGSPTGAASGDLSGSYPNPTVVAVHSGATMLSIGTITDGQMLVRSGGTIASQVVPTVVYGTTAGTAAQGNDSRLSDDRTASGIRTSTGVVSVSAAAAPSAGQSLVATGPSTATWQTVSGGGGGGDITSVIAGTGLSGGATTGDATLSVVYGNAANTATVGNDSRLSDDRTASGIRTASGVVAVSTATAPTTGQSLIATSPTTATWQTPTAAHGTQVASALIGTRGAINLLAGSNVTIAGVDNAGSDRVDVTISASGGGSTHWLNVVPWGTASVANASVTTNVIQATYLGSLVSVPSTITIEFNVTVAGSGATQEFSLALATSAALPAIEPSTTTLTVRHTQNIATTMLTAGYKSVSFNDTSQLTAGQHLYVIAHSRFSTTTPGIRNAQGGNGRWVGTQTAGQSSIITAGQTITFLPTSGSVVTAAGFWFTVMP